jgi:hypothetical protein
MPGIGTIKPLAAIYPEDGIFINTGKTHLQLNRNSFLKFPKSFKKNFYGQ